MDESATNAMTVDHTGFHKTLKSVNFFYVIENEFQPVLNMFLDEQFEKVNTGIF